MEAMPTGCANSLETCAGAYEWFAADGALKAVQLVHVRLLYNGPPSGVVQPPASRWPCAPRRPKKPSHDRASSRSAGSSSQSLWRRKCRPLDLKCLSALTSLREGTAHIFAKNKHIAWRLRPSRRQPKGGGGGAAMSGTVRPPDAAHPARASESGRKPRANNPFTQTGAPNRIETSASSACPSPISAKCVLHPVWPLSRCVEQRLGRVQRGIAPSAAQ